MNSFLHGKLITHMTVDYTDSNATPQQDVLHFFYDAQSRPAQVKFNGVIYTYVHNLQGDIVGLLDSTGALVVEYKYDAWGKPISTTGNLKDTLGKRNPFRYRGYVYDEETRLYYLRSRYYNPEVGRFINADKYIDGLSALEGCNLYAYCSNNLLTKADSNGTHSSSAFSEMPIAHDISKNSVANKACVTKHATDQLLTNGTIAIKQVKYICSTYSDPMDRIIETLLWFKNQVNHYAIWDYKQKERTPEWLDEHDETSVTINAIEMDMEDYGNFNYGFVGQAMGFPRSVLLFGSAYAHYTSHKNWDDDPHDWEMIDAGIEFTKQYQAMGMLSY